MRRVRIIRAIRVVSGPLSAGLIFAAALWGIGREVWVAKVFENMPALSDVPGVLTFYVQAFLATGIIEQALVLTACLAFVTFLASLLRGTGQEIRFA